MSEMDEIEFKAGMNTLRKHIDAVTAPETRSALDLIRVMLEYLNECIIEIQDSGDDA
jgi:hypothetical protein